GEHRDSQIQLGREQLAERAFRPRHAPLELCRERSVSAKPQAPRLRSELREPLTHVRMLMSTHSVEGHLLRQFDQLVDRAFHRMARAAADAFEHQRGDRYLPSRIEISDQVFLRY